MILSSISRTRRALQQRTKAGGTLRLANLGAKTTKTRLHQNLSGGPCAAGLGAPDACQCLPLWPITCAQSAIATLDRLDSATLSLAALSALSALSAQLVGGSCTLPGLQLDHRFTVAAVRCWYRLLWAQPIISWETSPPICTPSFHQSFHLRLRLFGVVGNMSSSNSVAVTIDREYFDTLVRRQVPFLRLFIVHISLSQHYRPRRHR